MTLMYHVAHWSFVHETQTTHQITTSADLSQGLHSCRHHVICNHLIERMKERNITDSVVFQEMNSEWHVVAVPQIVPEVEHEEGLSKRLSMIVNQTQSPAITLHLDPSFKNR